MKAQSMKKKTAVHEPLSSDQKPDKCHVVNEFVQSSRHTIHREELARIPIECVASIAASMNPVSPHEAIKRAYELLDIAAHVQEQLKDRKNHEEAIAEHLWTVTNVPLQNLGKEMPPDISKIGKHENSQMLPLKEILDSFWTTGASGEAGIKKASEKEVRIRRWLQDKFNYDVATAIDEVEKFKINGVPKDLYLNMRFHIRGWWIERFRLDNGERGANGGKASSAKKQQQEKSQRGSVKSNEDRRLGSKQLDLKEAIKRTALD